MIKYYGAVVMFLLMVACSPSADKLEFEREQAEIKAEILENHGGISLDLALQYGFAAPVVAEIDRQGTANFLTDEDSEWTALFTASFWGCERSVELLLSRGADPTIRSYGELPINAAWSRIYSDRARNRIDSGEMKTEKIENYKRVLAMLAVPEVEFEPRSEAAEGAVALEVVTHLLDNPQEFKSGFCLKVNGTDCPAPVIEALRKRGFPVYPVSKTPRHVLQFDIQWVADDQAEVRLYVPIMTGWDATVTYAYGHWMLDDILTAQF